MSDLSAVPQAEVERIIKVVSEGTINKTPFLQARKAELTREEAKLETILAEARKVHDAIVNDPRLIEARRVIKEISALLLPIKNELAALVKVKPSNRTMQLESGSGETKVGG